MNLEERIKKGMIFYETEHKSIENKEIEDFLSKNDYVSYVAFEFCK